MRKFSVNQAGKVQVWFWWPGLLISIILSIILTIVLNIIF